MMPSTVLFMRISDELRDLMTRYYERRNADHLTRIKDLEAILELVQKYGDARADQERDALIMV